MTCDKIIELIDTNITITNITNKKPLDEDDKKKIIILLSQKNSDNNQIHLETINKLIDLQRQAIFDEFQNKNVDTYYIRYVFFSNIIDFQHKLLFQSIDTIEWDKVIKILLDHLSEFYIRQDLSFSYRKEQLIVDIINKEFFKPYKIYIRNGYVDKSQKGLLQIAKRIDKIVASLGGAELLNFILCHLNTYNYSSSYYRYLLPCYSYPAGKPIHPNIPFNYLINLCIKYVNKKANPKHFEEDANNLFEIVNDYLFLFELQESGFTSRIPFPNQLNKDYIYKHLLYDNIYRFKQSNWKDFVQLLSELLIIDDENSQRFYNDQGFYLEDYINLVRKIYTSPSIGNITPTELLHSAFSDNELKILNKVSHMYTPNLNYVFPLELSKISFYKYPLIKLNNSSYYLINKPLAAWNFYNYIDLLNNSGKYIKIGDNIECIVKNEASKNPKYSVYSGKYFITPSHKSHHECDIVIQEDDCIIFIETKKKSISGDSLAGDTTNLLFDLSTAFINALSQLNFHELYLRKNGNIEFIDGTKLVVNNPETIKIYKIAVSIFDLYMFNDNLFASSLEDYLRHIQYHFSNELSATKEELKKQNDRYNINTANKKAEQLEQCISKIDKLFKISPQANKLFSFFYSLEQIIFLLKQARNTNSTLSVELDKLKNNTSLSGDFFSEYDSWANP